MTNILRNLIRLYKSNRIQFCNMNLSSKTSNIIEYDKAVEALNSLQSNRQVIEAALSKDEKHKNESDKVVSTLKFLERLECDVTGLGARVVHVAGTKGKGSTCAIVESILRNHGLKTGFFSSPHLIAVRERIRINGIPLSPDSFASHFWQVYNRLQKTKESKDDMPAYFKFLTVMAIKVMLEERVDVIVLEVGIGGEYDCTNFLSDTSVVGITSLGLDHTKLLGETVEEIAWQKGGIMKPGCLAISASHQPPSALAVLVQRAREKKCELRVAPEMSEYHWSSDCTPLQLNQMEAPQAINTSLAIQLAHAFLNRSRTTSLGLEVSAETSRGLASYSWPGRFQHIRRPDLDLYVDGAHTPESVLLCAQWFNSKARGDGERVLIFNATGQRQGGVLLSPLRQCHFSQAIFCPNIASTNPHHNPKDFISVRWGEKEQGHKCGELLEAWERLGGQGQVVGSVEAALASLPHGAQVLVTGSLHLVGVLLSLLTTQPRPPA